MPRNLLFPEAFVWLHFVPFAKETKSFWERYSSIFKPYSQSRPHTNEPTWTSISVHIAYKFPHFLTFRHNKTIHEYRERNLLILKGINISFTRHSFQGYNKSWNSPEVTGQYHSSLGVIAVWLIPHQLHKLIETRNTADGLHKSNGTKYRGIVR